MIGAPELHPMPFVTETTRGAGCFISKTESAALLQLIELTAARVLMNKRL